MIPFNLINEPPNFNNDVRIPGSTYIQGLLCKAVTIRSKHFKDRDFWNLVRPELKSAFNDICAYSGFIVHGSGEVDHYLSKTRHPEIAYEWNNYRFSSIQMNRKKQRKDELILDPFLVEAGWFQVHIPTFELQVTDFVPSALQFLASETIRLLELNHEDWKRSRAILVNRYINRPTITEADMDALSSDAPLLAIALRNFSAANGFPEILNN